MHTHEYNFTSKMLNETLYRLTDEALTFYRILSQHRSNNVEEVNSTEGTVQFKNYLVPYLAIHKSVKYSEKVKAQAIIIITVT